MRCARPGEEALQEGTPADARAVRSEGFEILRKAARAQSVVADRHRRRSNAAGAREAVGFAVERDIGIDPRHQRREIDREIARRSDEHTSELQSLMRMSYAVFCLKNNTLPHDSIDVQQ